VSVTYTEVEVVHKYAFPKLDTYSIFVFALVCTAFSVLGSFISFLIEKNVSVIVWKDASARYSRSKME